MTQKYFKLRPDVQLEKEEMDRIFDDLSESDQKGIRRVSRDLPKDAEKISGIPLTGLGHYGLLELLSKIALFNLASEATGEKSPDLRSKKVIESAFEELN